ncbi:MAG TPA: hypothetical protein VE010_13580 [Thermoanaerobaculia bacterium]|nr:hypothetical protein [Thermoanaerobaculia bacterium]
MIGFITNRRTARDRQACATIGDHLSRDGDIASRFSSSCEPRQKRNVHRSAERGKHQPHAPPADAANDLASEIGREIGAGITRIAQADRNPVAGTAYRQSRSAIESGRIDDPSLDVVYDECEAALVTRRRELPWIAPTSCGRNCHGSGAGEHHHFAACELNGRP